MTDTSMRSQPIHATRASALTYCGTYVLVSVVVSAPT